MRPPTLHIQEENGAASALTMRYTNGDNEIDLKAVYATVSSLQEHPSREHVDPRGKHIPCSKAFLDSFWSVAASLLDYFADFYTTDTALMQSVWFHILDEWQRARTVFASQLHSLPSIAPVDPLSFKRDCNMVLEIIGKLVNPASASQQSPSEPIIHNPSGTVQGPGGAYETGPFTSGLKPWQQFLYNGAPGFRPAMPDATSFSSTDAKEASPTRYLPQPGIALIQAHTARARALAATLAEKQGDDRGEALAAFDAIALATPSTPDHTFTYPSLTHPGTTLSYQLKQGAPPVKRHEGLTDPSMLIEKPGFGLLDEAVGSCKGTEAYVPMTGPVGQDGVGFDVWAVVERDALGWGSSATDERHNALVELLGEMFDDWDFGDEEE